MSNCKELSGKRYKKAISIRQMKEFKHGGWCIATRMQKFERLNCNFRLQGKVTITKNVKATIIYKQILVRIIKTCATIISSKRISWVLPFQSNIFENVCHFLSLFHHEMTNTSQPWLSDACLKSWEVGKFNNKTKECNCKIANPLSLPCLHSNSKF